MGEVYRARDTKLQREVAIKILPDAFAADPERRERFEREARTIAALNHPNIVTVYAVESTADALFLAMELVEGRPLSDLIPEAGLPLAHVLDVRQRDHFRIRGIARCASARDRPRDRHQ
jgi:serine/threonine-protein kinase